jgi:hypothetical protein
MLPEHFPILLKRCLSRGFQFSQLSRYSNGLQAGRGLIPSGESNFSILHSVQTQPSIQMILGAFSLGVKRQGNEADHAPPSSAEVTNGGVIPPHTHTSSWRNA